MDRKAVVVDAAPFRCARFNQSSDRATRGVGGYFLGNGGGGGVGGGGSSDHRCSGASRMEGQGRVRVLDSTEGEEKCSMTDADHDLMRLAFLIQ